MMHETALDRPKPAKMQPFRVHPDGQGYDVLRPTKGWLHVSAKRLRAQALMSKLGYRVLVRKLNAAHA